MATERLDFLLSVNDQQTVRGFQNVGKSAVTELGAVEKQVTLTGDSLLKLGAGALAAGTAVGTAVLDATRSAQDLADSWDKAVATFGKGAQGNLDAFAKGSADNLGKSSAAALDAASSYGLLLKGAQITDQKLAATSASLATRTADLAERYKTSFEEANSAISAAIKTGSNRAYKGLLQYGIAIDETAVKNEALNLGLAKQGDTLTRQQKALATASLVLKQSADSAGFLAASTDDSGAAMDKMRAKWENAKASFGEASIPALTSLATTAGSILEKFNALPPAAKEVAGSFAVLATGALGAVGVVSTLAGAFVKLKEAQQNSQLLGAVGTGPVAALAAAFVLQGELDAKVIGEQADWLEKAAGSAEDYAKSLPTNDLKALEAQARAASDAISKGPDLGKWQATEGVLRNALGFLGGGGLAGALAGGLFGDKGAQDQQIAAFNASVDAFKQSLAGVDPETAKQRIAAFIDGFKGGIVPTSELARLQKILNDEFAQTKPPAKQVDDYTGKLKGAGDAVERLRAILSGSGADDDKVASVLEAIDQGAKKANPSVADLAGVAEQLGIPLADLVTQLEANGVAVDTWSEKYAQATAKAKQSFDLVMSFERALLARNKAQQALEDLPQKQADAQQQATDRVADATDNVTEAIKRRAKAQRELDELNKKSAVAGSVPLLQEITRAAAEMEQQAQAAAQVAAATYGVGSDQALRANRLAADATRRREQAGGFLNQALAEQKGVNAQARADAADAVAQADKGVTRASRDRVAAEKALIDVNKNAADERKQAQLDFDAAKQAVKETFGTLEAAARDGIVPADQFAKAVADMGAEAFNALSPVQQMTAVFAILGKALTPTAFQQQAQGILGTAGQFITGAPPITQQATTTFQNIGQALGPAPTTTTVNHNYNIVATQPVETAEEIARRQKAKLIEQKLKR